MLQRYIFIVLIFAALTACEKNQEEFEASEIYACDYVQYPDSTTIYHQLIGSWKWTYFKKAYDIKYVKANKKIAVVFSNDNKFILMEDDIIISNGTWNLERSSSYFSLQTIPFNNYLGGPVYVCGDKLLFYNSIFDGDDYVFEKSK